MRQIAEREKGRIKQVNKRNCWKEITKIIQDISDIQDRLNILQNGVFQGNEKLDRHRKLVNQKKMLDELESRRIGRMGCRSKAKRRRLSSFGPVNKKNKS